MKASSIVLILSLLISINSYCGGDNGGSGGGGPSIILRTLDNTNIRVITGGHWDLDQYDEDILVIPAREDSILNYKFEIIAPEGTSKEVKLKRLIREGRLEIINEEEINLDTYWAEKKKALEIFKKYSY